MTKPIAQNKYYLVEDYSPSIDYRDGAVISLTPEACYQLGKAGIKYNILEDFYEEKMLKTDDDRYFTEQLKWFKDFDKILKGNIDYCSRYDLELARSHYYALKYFVDSVIIQARIFGDVISRIKPDGIVYVCEEKGRVDDFDIYDLCNNRRSFFLKLSSLICKKHAVPLQVEYSPVKNAHVNYMSIIIKFTKIVLKKIRLKSVYYFFKYRKYSKFISGRNNGLSMLVLHSGWLGIDILARKVMALGDKIYFMDGSKITRVSDVIQKDVLDLTKYDISEKQKINDDCIKVFAIIMTSKEITGWINDKCGIEITGLVEPYFLNFLENICAKNISEFILLKKFYYDKKIDLIIVRSSAEKDSIGPLLAARCFGKRLCFQHGIMHDKMMVALTELDLVDQYFAMDGISEEYFKDCLRLGYASGCKISQSSHYLRAVAERCERKRFPGPIVYAPTRIFAGLNVFNVNYYTLTRYYEFQKAVIDLLGSIKDKHFIYKCTKDQEWLSNSVLQHLKDRGYKNIVVEKKPLLECLHKTERLILDYPSTGFYEAAACGISVMSLWYDTFKIDGKIKSYFGRSLKDFSTIPEAIQHIRDFIDAPAENFVMDLPLNDASITDILKEIRDKKGLDVTG